MSYDMGHDLFTSGDMKSKLQSDLSEPQSIWIDIDEKYTMVAKSAFYLKSSEDVIEKKYISGNLTILV